MTVLDAYGLIAFLAGEPARDEVETILRAGSTRTSATNLAETYDRAMRTHALERDELDRLVEGLIAERAITIISLDDRLARRAGELRSRFDNRCDRDLSHADCVAAATAESLADRLATSDVHLAGLARTLGVEVIALPDSAGRRP